MATSPNSFIDGVGLGYYDGKIHSEIGTKADKTSVPTKVSQLTNDSGFITMSQVPEGAVASSTTPKMDGTAAVGTESAFARGDHVHPTDTSRLATTGDASQTTVSFNPAATREDPASGETEAIIVGKVVKYLADLGLLAFKDGVAYDDLDAAIKTSLAKADSALQSYTETDPTVPEWAKAATKPTYTATEVGAIPATQADSFAKKSDLTAVYRYKGSVETVANLPTADNTIGDVWNVEADDMNYGWTGEDWDPLGQPFQITAITNTEIDAIMAANRA